MQIEINARDLKAFLKTTNKKNTFEVLNYFKIEVKDQLATFQTTDTDLSTELMFPVESEDWCAFYSIERLAKTRFKAKDQIIITPNEILVNGATVLKSHNLDRMAWPDSTFELEIKTEDRLCRLETETMTKFCTFASDDECRMEFTGLFVTNKGDLVVTDGHRLAVKTGMCERDPKEAKDLILPAKAIRRMQFGESTVFADKVDNGRIAIMTNTEGGMWTYVLRLIPGHCPDFSKVIPKTIDHSIVLEKASMDQILAIRGQYTRKIASEHYYVTYRGKAKDLSIERHYDERTETEIGNIDHESEYAGNLRLNLAYLCDLLEQVEEDSVCLQIVNEDSPVIIRLRNNITHVIMPIAF